MGEVKIEKTGRLFLDLIPEENFNNEKGVHQIY